jgi:hypothetical protein
LVKEEQGEYGADREDIVDGTRRLNNCQPKVPGFYREYFETSW